MAELFQFADKLGSEVQASRFLPYTSHVTEHVIKMADGSLLQMVKLQGAAHESADIEDINNWHSQLNGLMRNIAAPDVALWTHVVRREFHEYPGGEFAPGFCHDFNEKYRQHVASDRMLLNELYLTIIYRPDALKISKWLDIFNPKSHEELEREQLDHIEKIEEITGAALAALFRYEPELLGCYEHNGLMHSELLEFLAFLVNGEWQRVPVPTAEIRDVLTRSRAFFGQGGTMSLRCSDKDIYASILAVQEYPAMTQPGLLNDLLSLPFEMVISQSFTFLSKPVAVGRMQRQYGRMVTAGDLAKSQVNAIHDALDALISNKFVMGAHNISLMIYADNRKKLIENVNLAGAALSNIGIKWTREDMGIAGSFYAMLPGNFEYRVSDDRDGKDHAKKLSPIDLALMLQEKGATGKTRVMLDSCDTGRGQQSFARKLSHYFEVVEAPTRKTWAFRWTPGSLTLTSDHESLLMQAVAGDSSVAEGESERPNVNDSGRWKEFHSEDYAYCKAHPECDTPESELPGRRFAHDPKTNTYYDARNSGDEKPMMTLGSHYALSPRVGLDELRRQQEGFVAYKKEMVNEYLSAAKENKPERWADAIEKFPLMAVAYKYRSSIMEAAQNKTPQMQEGLDRYITGMIANGRVRELADMIPQNQHQSLSMH